LSRRAAGDITDACANKTVDVIFALDSSYSMRDSLRSTAEIVYTITQAIKQNPKNRVALFQYTDTTEELSWAFKLFDDLNSEELKEKILAIQWQYNYGEDHGLAITTAKEDLIGADRRDRVARTIVVFTDGESENQDLSPVVKDTLCNGPSIIAIGIPTEQVPAEDGKAGLEAIAGGKRDKVLTTNDANTIYEEICKNLNLEQLLISIIYNINIKIYYSNWK